MNSANIVQYRHEFNKTMGVFCKNRIINTHFGRTMR